MSMWILWLIIFVLLLISELMTLTFYLLWLSIGALVAAGISAIFPEQLWLQVIVGCLTAVALTIFTKPLTVRIRQARGFKDAIDQLVGKHGEVIEAIPSVGLGRVRVGTEVWSAAADEPLEQGSIVIVLSRGNTIIRVAKSGGE